MQLYTPAIKIVIITAHFSWRGREDNPDHSRLKGGGNKNKGTPNAGAATEE